jgi:hypothetical protein
MRGAPGDDAGFDWLLMLRLCSNAYMVSSRGALIPASRAMVRGEPRYTSVSIGRLARKSWYMILGFGVGRHMFSIVLCLKLLGNLQP